ncbi:MAG: amidase [Candidatus Dadabacteria bacterium]|nr:MAG: amidase [Candidatus Dadabacteria bacterium]
MTTSELLTLSATRLAEMIRAREVTSRDVVDAHIAWAQVVNPQLNAIVENRFDAARTEADAIDEQIAAGQDPGPFGGVPCTIKECFAFAGMPNSSGLVARRDIRPTADATAVARIRNAGAVPLGVTNISELCMWMETNNRVYGRTNNPYNPAHIVGGSSGGEGAIIGSGASPFGLGSDIGGSIRMPAFFNGVFGHKPTGGLVPGTGQFPIAEGAALRYLTTGPLARRAEDLWPLLNLLRGPDGEDAGCIEWELGDPDNVDLSSLRILNVPDNGKQGVAESLRLAQQRVAAHLESLGATSETKRYPALADSFAIWSSMLGDAESPSSFRTNLQRPRLRDLWAQTALWLARNSEHTIPALILGLVENLGDLAPARKRAAIEAGLELRETIERDLGDNGIMLYPSYVRPAPKHVQPLLPPLTFSWVYTAILNVLELPVTQVPLGLDHQGLPVGVQVAARRGNDHLTIAVAQELERAFGGWVPPWTVSEHQVG